MTMTATYSPEDNKLRLYASQRLGSEEYAQVRAAGFIWAPKQDLFVAPMWTPEREDLLLSFCDEIGDEDTGLVERAEQRADRFEDYSESRASDAQQARQAVSAIADNIPLGQPILVGHHSEKRARKDAERIENGMRKAIKMWDQAQYWAARAKGALRHAKYKERPDVRARRIKKIEADKRKQERQKAEHESALRFWQGKFKLTNKQTGEKKPLEITEANRETLFRILGSSEFGHMGCAVREGGSGSWDRWSVWDVLRPEEERYKACPAWTVQQCQDRAFELYPALIERCNRWIAHYENRLAYEKAMLDEGGGTAADRVKPEAGGACRWADFTRVIPFDKLFNLMSRARVDEARTGGRLLGETKRGFVLLEAEAPQPQKPAEPKPEAADFNQLRDTLRAGVQVVSANQLFPTPPEIAQQVIDSADIQEGNRVLEPSAGTGAIASVVATQTRGTLLCVEINPQLAEGLTRAGYVVQCADFLTCNGDLGKFDRIVMNPPFENGADIKHITHARTFLKPGGRLVAICANGPQQKEALQGIVSEWIDLPEGSFKESGTMVNAAIIVIDN